MTDTAHTNAPWTCSEPPDPRQNRLYICGPRDARGNAAIIAEVLQTQYAELGKSQEQRDNAALIAAAPELLKACEYAAMAHSTAGGCDVPPWLQAVRDAIAKATK